MIKLRKFSSIEKYFYRPKTGFLGYDIYFFVTLEFITGRNLGCEKQNNTVFSSEKYFLERERKKRRAFKSKCFPIPHRNGPSFTVWLQHLM